LIWRVEGSNGSQGVTASIREAKNIIEETKIINSQLIHHSRKLIKPRKGSKFIRLHMTRC